MKSQRKQSTRYFHRQQSSRRDRGGDPHSHSHHLQQQMMMNSLFCEYPVPGNLVPFHSHHHYMQTNYPSQHSQYSASSAAYLMPPAPLHHHNHNKGLKTQLSSPANCSAMGQYYATAAGGNGYSVKLPPPPPPMPCSVPKTLNYGSVNGNSYPSTFSSSNSYSSSSTSYSSTPSSVDQQQNSYEESRPPTPPSVSPPRAPVIEEKQRKGPPISVSMDGFVQHLPKSMLNDQYGLAALLVGFQARKCIGPIPDTLCNDVLDEMNVALTAYPNEPLYQSFSGPLTVPSEPKSFSTEQNGFGHQVCPEYQVTHRLIFENQNQETDMNQIRSTYALKFDKFSEDLLFFVFYTCSRDILQLVAALNLYQKGWRYHTEHKVWLQRIATAVYTPVPESPGSPYQERGLYNCFDFVSWKTVQVEISLDMSKLEPAPKLPPEYFVSSSSPKS